MNQFSKSAKPSKPHKDFPLFPHASGRWAKKVRGKHWYFGPWDDPQAALNKWLEEKDDLLAGRVPRGRTSGTGCSMRDLCNQFLTTKQNFVDSGELSHLTLVEYKGTCDRLIAYFGRHRLLTDLLPEDFEPLRAEWAKRWGATRLNVEIGRARLVFNYANKNGLIAGPLRYGEGFNRPSSRTLRLARLARGVQMFEPDELKRLLSAAGLPMRAMILLGVNAGFGNSDVGRLPMKALDLKPGWLNYPRPKTGIARRCPLWRETVAAIREWLPNRPAPLNPAYADRLFLTTRGGSWAKERANSPVSRAMQRLLKDLDIGGNRNFYALRHTFETIAGESRDQVAVDYIMGHARHDMASVYRERISDERLKAVTDFVHTWLFGRASRIRSRRSVA